MTTTDHLDFSALVADADTHFTRTAELADLESSFSGVLLTSAIAKCLDFNELAQDTDSKTMPVFFLVANVRAICEDLVYCSLFKRIGQQQSDDLAMKLNRHMLLKNVLAQTRFFALNNKLQPTLGGLTGSSDQADAIEQSTQDLVHTWERLGFTKSEGRLPPALRRLSHSVGLETMYDYTYHLTSNFVHFNPGQLFRTGWGPTTEGPFSFSVHNFGVYFSDLARFLGALVLLGYCHLAPDRFDGANAARYATTINSRLQGSFRWPEITTYEEMNQTWPNNIILRSAMTVMRQGDPNAMPNVLTELQGLANPTPKSANT